MKPSIRGHVLERNIEWKFSVILSFLSPYRKKWNKKKYYIVYKTLQRERKKTWKIYNNNAAPTKTVIYIRVYTFTTKFIVSTSISFKHCPPGQLANNTHSDASVLHTVHYISTYRACANRVWMAHAHTHTIDRSGFGFLATVWWKSLYSKAKRINNNNKTNLKNIVHAAHASLIILYM